MVDDIGGVILVGGASVAAIGLLLAAGMKPDLDARNDAVRHEWSPVSTALDGRTRALDRLDDALDARGAHAIAGDASTARTHWSKAKNQSLTAQITAGNDLESVSARALALAATPAYASNGAPAAAAVTALDKAIAHANAVEDNRVRALVAKLAGHHDLPTFLGAS